MVIHDEETLQQAMSLVDVGPVRYSDQNAYIIITTPETLELQCRRALGRGDIAIVVPIGQERLMEIHTAALRRVKKQRAADEKKAIRQYVSEHPDIVERAVRREKKQHVKGTDS